MKSFTGFVVCLFGLFVLCAGKYPPSGSTPPSYVDSYSAVNATSYAINTVIGQPNFTATGDDLDAQNTAQAITSPKGLTYIPYSNATMNFSIGSLGAQGGLLAVDYQYNRLLFFPAPLTGQVFPNASKEFGQISFNDTSSDLLNNVYDTDYSSFGVYALTEYFLAFWSWESINPNLSSYPNPDQVIGNCTTCNYHSFYSAENVAVKQSTGEVFVSSSYCESILIFPANPTATTNAIGIIGQDSISGCDTSCDDSTTSTCLDNPTYMAFDCYDGLWVLNSDSTSGIYHFANGSTTSYFGIVPDDTASYEIGYADSLTWGPGCNQLTVGTRYRSYIIRITFVGATPTLATTVSTFGGVYGTTAGAQYTDSLQYSFGVAVDNQNAVMYVSDYYNNRVVGFPLNGTQGGANSASPSPVSVTPSRSYGASYSSSPTPASMTSTATSGTSPSNSPPANDNSSGFHFTGGSSSLSSWLHMF